MSAKKAVRKKPCDCVKKMNKMLAPRGYRLPVVLNLGKTSSGWFLYIPVEKLASFEGRRKSPPNVIPNFCPFCGVKIDYEWPSL